MKAYDLAIVGAGQIAEEHAVAAAALGHVNIAAVVDSNADAAHKFAARWGVTWTGQSLDAAARDCHLDGVIVCSPTALHHQHASEAVALRIPALVEKPFATNLADARSLITAAEREGVPLIGAQILRFLPMFQWARELIASGTLGTPIQAIERRLVDRADNFPWWKDLPQFLVSHWGSHSIDLLCFLFADQASRVYCQADSVRSAFGVVDDFSMQVRFASGLRATSSMSFSSTFVVHDLVLIGTEATASFDCYQTARLNGDVVMSHPEAQMLSQGFQSQLAAFVAEIDDTAAEPHLAAAPSLLPGLEALSAAEESARTGELVTVDRV